MIKIVFQFLIYLIPIYGYSQEIIHDFHSARTIPDVDAFIRRGLKLKSCAEIKLYAEELKNLPNDPSFFRAFSLTKLSTSGDEPALGQISREIVEKLKRFNCDENRNSKSNVTSANNENSGGGQNFNNVNSSILNQELINNAIASKIQKQSQILDYKGENKYSFLEDYEDDKEMKNDVLFLPNGSKLKVIIIRISNNQIYYKKKELPDGPTFVIKLNSVKAIKTVDGDVKNNLDK